MGKSSCSTATPMWRVLLRGLVGLAGLSLVSIIVLASNPTSGSIASTSSAVTWKGTATGTGAVQDESTCVEGVNCDSFALNVEGTQVAWSKSLIDLKLAWTVPANDYDLFVHKGGIGGPVVASSANGAPETGQEVTFDPAALGTGTYTVHVCYWATTPSTDQYIGKATVIPRPAGRHATVSWIKSQFAPNQTTTAAMTQDDGEPSARCDNGGHYYVAGIRGVPAGCDLWYFDLNPNSPTYDPLLQNAQYRGQPDGFSADSQANAGSDGGGDVDIALGNGNGANNVPTIAFSSLTAANVSTSISQDLGNSWTKNPAGNATGGAPVDDRQWLAFYGNKTVYLYYRTLEPAVSQVQVSTNGGLTYGPATSAGTLGQAGSIDVDQRDGTVYLSGSSGQVAVGTPDPRTGYPLTYNVYQAASDPNGVAALFFVVKVAPDGTVYGAYSNGKHVYLISSPNRGKLWSTPVQVDFGPITATSLFPALAVGPVRGSVAVGWYGTTDSINDNKADWRVFLAQTWDALDGNPKFTAQVVSDHFIHSSNISLGGTLGNANRNLLDYFQICYDPVGALLVAYTDDHNDFSGNVYVTRQMSGKGMAGTVIPPAREGPQVSSPQPYSPDGAQVVGTGSVDEGLLVSVPAQDPLGIQEIRYSSASNGGHLTLTAAMKVTSLATIPANSTWRMNFAANCPGSVPSSTGMTTFGSSDRGNDFFVEASTSPQGARTYSYGTVVRNSDGSLTDTVVGPADAGSFDPTTNTITVSVLASRLNALIKNGPPIKSGSVLAGLRGSASTVSGDLREARTRGGLQYMVP